MKYKALRDSFDHARTPRYCQANKEYEFDADPGAHFVVASQTPKNEGPSKEELIARAELLGIEVDKRKSVANIQKAIEEAERGDE